MTVSAVPSTPSLSAPSQETVTATLMAAKKAKGMSFADLESALGLDEVWIASLFYGQATASKEEAEKLAELLSLDPSHHRRFAGVSHQGKPRYRGFPWWETPAKRR